MQAQADPRLSAVMARDPRADGAFVYAVRTTGIFCRPSCAARRPRLDRIAFFPTPGDARQAGFRACRRCQPESAESARAALAQRVCRLIDEADEQVPSLARLASHFGFSSDHLARTFKAVTGITPRAYASLNRVERLKARLRSGDNVTEALYAAGYGSSSRLYEHGRVLLGMTPNEYRRAGHGSRIDFTIVACRLGFVLVAASGRGICAVNLGDSEADLERGMRKEFSAASLERNDAALAPMLKRIVAHIECGERLRGLTLDIAATAFTRSVWKALAGIPYGQTRTYAQIARSIGHPRAARAVARACAANKLALVIPCHRAVPKAENGGGYRWGAARKRALLARERELSAKR